MTSGRKSKAARRATAAAPPPVHSKGGPRRQGGLAAYGRRTVAIGAVAAALVVAAIVAAVVLARGGSTGGSAPAAIPWTKLAPLQNGSPPWTNDVAQLPDRLSYIGLNQLGSEGSVLHIHQHLDLYVNGKKVGVPAGIGIYGTSWITEVHVHDTSGVVHVESPTQRTFRLGQLFGEWGVKLTANCVGRYCGHVRWWVNGRKMAGDPAALALKAHQEIVIAAGPPPLVVPKSYTFPAGE